MMHMHMLINTSSIYLLAVRDLKVARRFVDGWFSIGPWSPRVGTRCEPAGLPWFFVVDDPSAAQTTPKLPQEPLAKL